MWHNYPFCQINEATKREGEYRGVFGYVFGRRAVGQNLKKGGRQYKGVFIK